MVPDPVAGLHDHQVESQRQMWDRLTVRKRTAIEQAVGGGPDPRPLPVVDRFLGQAERTSGPPADLDHHERPGRTRVDRHEVELVATDMDVPGQDGPTGVRETHRDDRLGGIARLLGRRSRRSAGLVRHGGSVARGPYPPRIHDVSVVCENDQTGVPNSNDSRSRLSSMASSAMTGTSSRARSS